MIYIFIIFILLILILITKYFVDKKIIHYKEHQTNQGETSTTVAAATVLYEGEDMTYECPKTDQYIHGSDNSALKISDNSQQSGLSIENDKIKIASLGDHADPEKIQCKCKPPGMPNYTTGECDYPIKWKVGMKGESCTAVCNNLGGTCDQGISQLQNIDSADKLRSVVMKIHAYDATDNNFFCGGNGDHNQISSNFGWLGPASNNTLVPHSSIVASQCLPPDGSTSADCDVANTGVKRLCCCPSANDPLDKVCPIGSNSIAEWESAGVPKCASDFSWGSNICSQTFEQQYFPALSMQKINDILAPDGLILSASEASKDDDINNTTPLSMSTSGGNAVRVINTASNKTIFTNHLQALIKQVGRVLLVVKVKPLLSNLTNIPTGFETKEFTLMLYMDNPPAGRTSGSSFGPKYHFGSDADGIASGPPNWDHIVTSHEARFNGDNRATQRMNPNGTSGFNSQWSGAGDDNVYTWIRSSVKRGGSGDDTVFEDDDFNTRYVTRNGRGHSSGPDPISETLAVGTWGGFFTFGQGYDFTPNFSDSSAVIAYSNAGYSYVKEGSTQTLPLHFTQSSGPYCPDVTTDCEALMDCSSNGVGKNIKLDILSMSLYGVKLGGSQEHIKALMYQRGVINYALHKDNYILDPNPQMSKMWVNTGSDDGQFWALKNWFKNTLLTQCQKTVMVMTVKIRSGTHKGKEFTWMACCTNWPTDDLNSYGNSNSYPVFIRSSVGTNMSLDNFNTKVQSSTDPSLSIYSSNSSSSYLYTLGAHNFFINNSGAFNLSSNNTSGPGKYDGGGNGGWNGSSSGGNVLQGNINDASSTAHMVRMSIYGVHNYSLGYGAQSVFYLNNILAKDNLILGMKDRPTSTFSSSNVWRTVGGVHNTFWGLKQYFHNTILANYDKSICFITLQHTNPTIHEFSLMLYCANFPTMPANSNVGSSYQNVSAAQTWIRSSIGYNRNNDAFKTKYLPSRHPEYATLASNSQTEHLFTIGGGHDVQIKSDATPGGGTIYTNPHSYKKEGSTSWSAENRAFNGSGAYIAPADYNLIRVEIYGVLNKDGSL